MAVYADISHALNDRLAAYATAQSLPVQWENRKFKTPDGEIWLKPTAMFSRSEPVTLGRSGLKDYPGIYQVSIFSPLGEGAGGAKAHVDGICNQFESVASLVEGAAKVRIARVYAGTGIPETVWFHIPVSIEFFCLAANA